MPYVMASQHGSPSEAPLSFEQLYEKYCKLVRVLLARLLGPDCVDLDDLAQEVFVVVLKNFPALPIEQPVAWLYQIALRVAAGARRRARFRRWMHLGPAAEPSERRTPEVLVGAEQEMRRVYAALDALSEKRRTVFILYEMQGLGGPEIAEALGIPIKTVYTRLYHARRDFLAEFERALGRPA